MPQRSSVILSHRAILRVTGPDLRAFLQGIVSNDVEKVSPEQVLWSAFLTPQGKFLHEFFMILSLSNGEEAFLLDCEAARRTDLQRRLSMYKLRSKVAIEDAEADFVVAVLFGRDVLDPLGLPDRPGAVRRIASGILYVDPRSADLGARAVLKTRDATAFLSELGFPVVNAEDYDRLRISFAVPDGSRDMEVEKSVLLENRFDELHGIDWEKGCFMGQELTARTKYRGLAKKRLMTLKIEGPAPESGTPLTFDGKEVGIMRSSAGDLGLALVRLKGLEAARAASSERPVLSAGAAQLFPLEEVR